jgi:hypothetical protein
MGKETGILLTDENDLKIVVVRDAKGLILSGMVIGDVTLQNQKLIIYSEKGEIKTDPYLGVGLVSFLDDDDPSELLREVRTNLRADGQTVQRCGFNSEGKLVVVGGYGSN